MSGPGVKKVLVTGATGYVGNYLLKAIARHNPAVQCLGMSRRGTVRAGETQTGELENVSFLAADCTKPETFENALADVDAVVHCVGILFVKAGQTHDLMNRDSCINMAAALQKYAAEAQAKRNFVMISSAKAPFFD